MPVFALSLHARYSCQRSLACCTSGWPISVEPPIERALREGLHSSRLLVAHAPDAVLPLESGGTTARLGTDVHGRCLFLESSGAAACAIHRQLGPDALPVSCRLFPRVCLLTPRGVSITLSHYCPTAAGLLFRDGPVAIEEDPPAFPPGSSYEGLDARHALPPLLRPDALLCWESHALWERHAIAVCADGNASPEQCLSRLRDDAERARGWTPSEGSFLSFLARVLDESGHAKPSPRLTFTAAATDWAVAASCVPPTVTAPSPGGPELTSADARWVEPAWDELAGPVRRYLAARAFASWCAVQGRGLRTAVRALELALGVLRYEAAREALRAARRLDAALLLRAVRTSDLLLVHLAAPEVLARRLSIVEDDAPRRPRGSRSRAMRGTSVRRP